MNRTREETIQIFVRCLRRYFARYGDETLEIHTPYLLTDKLEVFDFTAIIGISGDQKGTCYFTASRGLLEQLGHKLGEIEISLALLCDLAGEIANTLSGNARLELGPGFMISVPVTFEGKPAHLHLARDLITVALPILWQKQPACLIVSLQNFGTVE